MKRIILPFMVMCLLSCDMLGPGAATAEAEGQLRISFACSPDQLTRSMYEIPDTSDFILTEPSGGSVSPYLSQVIS